VGLRHIGQLVQTLPKGGVVRVFLEGAPQRQERRFHLPRRFAQRGQLDQQSLALEGVRGCSDAHLEGLRQLRPCATGPVGREENVRGHLVLGVLPDELLHPREGHRVARLGGEHLSVELEGSEFVEESQFADFAETRFELERGTSVSEGDAPGEHIGDFRPALGSGAEGVHAFQRFGVIRLHFQEAPQRRQGADGVLQARVLKAGHPKQKGRLRRHVVADGELTAKHLQHLGGAPRLTMQALQRAQGFRVRGDGLQQPLPSVDGLFGAREGLLGARQRTGEAHPGRVTGCPREDFLKEGGELLMGRSALCQAHG
jgi:hypothetical protein